MKPKPCIGRSYALCLLSLAGVLVLGIIQWSFLPILVQDAPGKCPPALEFSASHLSKSAAPFKCLFGDASSPFVVPSKVTVRRIISTVFRLPDFPLSGQDEFSLTNRPLRSPPFA